MLEQPYYHIYNRGAHKAAVFNGPSDYERMIKLLYIANNTEPFVMRDLNEFDIFSVERKGVLVDIIAYCLMPNHFHICLRPRPITYVGHMDIDPVTRFMRKLASGYSNYFNLKYDHSGTIWQGKYKAKAVHDEEYLRILINYIHLNPYGIETPDMTKEARMEHLEEAITASKNYEYSSFKEYFGEARPQSSILVPYIGPTYVSSLLTPTKNTSQAARSTAPAA